MGSASTPSAAELPRAAIRQFATVRLVPDAYDKPPVLSALVDTDEERAVLEALEGLTSTRLTAEREGLTGLDPRELTYAVWGHTFINAAFTYTRPEGNRFNDATRGAWYCAFEDLTALDEVAFHRKRELERIGVFEDEVIYRALLADFVGEFMDLRDLDPRPLCLDPDPAVAYPVGQTLARDLREADGNGIIYPSVRRPGGTCLVALRPHFVQNVRVGARWKLGWTGNAEPTITAL